ncbi:MAG: pyruvate kinase [Fimbriimonas sp.]|nr:pyruvate kinase [Fimbriimonas sp.]
MKRRTKIVCTLGPAVDSKEKVKSLIDAGMNVARLNCSHGDWERKAEWIRWVRELSAGISPVGIIVDLQGPKFRIGDLPGGFMDVERGQTVRLGEESDVDIPIHQPEILRAMGVGGRLLLGDGEVELRIQKAWPDPIEAKVVIGGRVASRRGVTLVGQAFDSPALTEKDRLDVVEAVRYGADYIALSYVKRASDAQELRDLVDTLDPRIGICAKIEMRQGIHDLANILKVVDVVMVARGDMGLQMDIEEVPLMQKRIIQTCSSYGTPVITATQMLESMINNPRPTRAEATDVANAILDGTDAVMLSGETASGNYPEECVLTMARIAERAESMYDESRIEREFQARRASEITHTDAIAHSVGDLARCLRPQAILTLTSSGRTPRLVSMFRPKQPILCSTWDETTQRQLSIVWGVETILTPRPSDTEKEIHEAIAALLAIKRLKLGELVIITAGLPGTTGHTNMIRTLVV